MNYELAKELRDAGFPPPGPYIKNGVLEFVGEWAHNGDKIYVFFPTLSELIEACSIEGFSLKKVSEHATREDGENWACIAGVHGATGSSPEEAVARLWLALNTTH